MLFHVIMTHTPGDCPGYNREKMPAVMAAFEKLDAIGKQFNVKVHFLVNAAPEHVSYALLEAESPAAVASFTLEIPMRQDFKVTPVQNQQEMIAMAKAMMEQR